MREGARLWAAGGDPGRRAPSTRHIHQGGRGKPPCVVSFRVGGGVPLGATLSAIFHGTENGTSCGTDGRPILRQFALKTRPKWHLSQAQNAEVIPIYQTPPERRYLQNGGGVPAAGHRHNLPEKNRRSR